MPEISVEKKRGRPKKDVTTYGEAEHSTEVRGELYKSTSGEIMLRSKEGRFYDIATGDEITA